ncbi:DUF817 domain-containing protein [Hyphomonas sp.]|uniref:DUF817 domain-containing protein n=1 Tax=Hyphomonas sp. TaxID=87 RepID=UPI0025BBF87D|nr:DUF817 domain-containing protein [Hyphomonas sp.]MBI1399204.1 DUF817 family protein [Hyphomonas sp.]
MTSELSAPARLRARLHAARESLRARWVKGPFSLGLFEFVSFGIKQAWACLFGGAMLSLLLLTHLFYPEGAALSRYDFLVLAAITLQAAMILSGLETWEEARVILVFHIVGTIMELFKTSAGSWIYPEHSYLRIGAVPLFSGFMYAAVGSYLARVWRIFEFRFDRFPPLWLQGLLAAAIYVNFFAHHWLADIRLGLFAAIAVIYLRTVVWFRPDEVHRPMPLLVGFFLVALFIWFAENLGTFARAWSYPGQEHSWKMVSLSKLGSWYLLMIISFVLVATVHRGAGGKKSENQQAPRREPR